VLERKAGHLWPSSLVKTLISLIKINCMVLSHRDFIFFFLVCESKGSVNLILNVYDLLVLKGTVIISRT
jgi:hypothetical protein